MTLREIKYNPPASRARAEISPSEPLTMPRARSIREASGISPCFRLAKGVAADTMSGAENKGIFVRTGGQVVINRGKLIRKARAERAGFIKFLPMPPNSCLTTIIAKASPISTIHIGEEAGRQ